METLLIEMQYLAPVSYYALLQGFGKIVIEQEENFVKSTYRNRCRILGPSGPLELSIPLEEGRDQRRLYKEVRISYREDWQRYHWKSIQSAYRNSPYFEYYEDHFRPFYMERHELLFEFNRQMMMMVCNLLKLEANIIYSNVYEKTPAAGKTDMRSKVHPNPRKDQTGSMINTVPYYQVFADRIGFQPNVSIIDLLFNEGPSSLDILKRSFMN